MKTLFNPGKLFPLTSVFVMLVVAVAQEPEPEVEDCRLVTMDCNAYDKVIPGTNGQFCCMKTGGKRAGTCGAARRAEETGGKDSLLDDKRCGKKTKVEDGVCGDEEVGPCAANQPKYGCISKECP